MCPLGRPSRRPKVTFTPSSKTSCEICSNYAAYWHTTTTTTITTIKRTLTHIYIYIYLNIYKNCSRKRKPSFNLPRANNPQRTLPLIRWKFTKKKKIVLKNSWRRALFEFSSIHNTCKYEVEELVSRGGEGGKGDGGRKSGGAGLSSLP